MTAERFYLSVFRK